jgi:hypothetical protein
MGTKTEAERLRAEIAALSEVRKARRYPAGLKRRVARWAAGEVASGASIAGLAMRIDIGEPTLTRFLDEARKKSAPVPMAGFARVKVTKSEPAPSVERIVVRGPHGVAVEGLCIETLAQLLKRLSCSG